MLNDQKYVHSGPMYTSGRVMVVQKTGRNAHTCLLHEPFYSKNELAEVLLQFEHHNGISVTINFNEPDQEVPGPPVVTFNDKIEEIMNGMGLPSDSNLTLKDVHMRIRAAMKIYRDYLLNE